MARARARVWDSDLREAELLPAWSGAIVGANRWFSGHCADRRPLAQRRQLPRWVVVAETTTPARASWWGRRWRIWMDEVGGGGVCQREKWARVFFAHVLG
jgi:hypothetical protein